MCEIQNDDTRLTDTKSTRLDRKRSKREDQEPMCPKCKQPLENAKCLMLGGVDKMCFHCDDYHWNSKLGFLGCGALNTTEMP